MRFKVGDILITSEGFNLVVKEIENNLYFLLFEDGSSGWHNHEYVDKFELDKNYMLKKQFEQEMKEIINDI